jgi:hypothetical protein
MAGSNAIGIRGIGTGAERELGIDQEAQGTALVLPLADFREWGRFPATSRSSGAQRGASRL